MAAPDVLSPGPGQEFVCRGGKCDDVARCMAAKHCCYKSSAEEARELLHPVHKIANAAVARKHDPSLHVQQCQTLADVTPCPDCTTHKCATLDEALGCTVCRDAARTTPVPVFKDGKETNPKDALGAAKVPLHLVSGVVKAYQAVAHYLGNVKYGAWNYRAGGARASVYRAALDRHMDRWWEGEELDPVDGTPHLANALCCINILIECVEGGNLVDDRPPSRPLGKLYERIEGMMQNIRARYKDKNPRHYTIADTPSAEGPCV